MPRFSFFIFIALCIGITGCNSANQEDGLPPALSELEPVFVVEEKLDEVPTMELTHKATYTENEQVIFGYLLNLEVDDDGNVFIADFTQKQIHVYDSEGNFIKSLGGEGLGPGEFQTFSDIKVKDGFLHVFDRAQFKINVFELNSLTFTEAVTVRQYPTNSEEYTEIDEWIPMYANPRYDGTMLMGFVEHPRDSRIDRDTYNIGQERIAKYYLMDYDRKIISEKLFEIRGHEDLAVTVNGKHSTSSKAQSYLGQSIVTVAQKQIITNWTDEFLLKIYNRDGSFDRAIYYPDLKKRKLTRMELIDSAKEQEWNRPVIEHAELPEHWPIIYTVILDEENRIWVAVIKEGKNLLQWHILNQEGELIAKANMPPEFNVKWLVTNPKISIKNGSLYTFIKNEQSGRNEAVGYDFDL